MDFFYDAQIRRYFLQFMRIFSDFKIQLGPDENGHYIQKRVPIKYGDISKMIAHALKEQSENIALSAPSMSAFVVALKQSSERRQDPTHISKKFVTERYFDTNKNQYTDQVDKSYQIESYMPVPYDLTMQLDIWTTNTTTKLQILEQILSIFNPSIQLQQNDNPIDWSSLFEVFLEENIIWSNRGIPQGANVDNDFASLTFTMQIWINPPARVKRKKVINQIITNVLECDKSFNKYFDPITSEFEKLDEIILTPNGYNIKIGTDGLGPDEVMLVDYNFDRGKPTWKELIDYYGTIDENSMMRLKTSKDLDDTTNDILGYISYHESDPNILLFNVDVDTLPSTFTSVDAIINPLDAYPGNGLPPVISGTAIPPSSRTKYLILSDVHGLDEPLLYENMVWDSDFIANNGDIIEFDGFNWVIFFDSTEPQSTDKYIINLSDNQHYKYSNEEWIHTYFGEYNSGYWRLENINKTNTESSESFI